MPRTTDPLRNIHRITPFSHFSQPRKTNKRHSLSTKMVTIPMMSRTRRRIIPRIHTTQPSMCSLCQKVASTTLLHFLSRPAMVCRAAPEICLLLKSRGSFRADFSLPVGTARRVCFCIRSPRERTTKLPCRPQASIRSSLIPTWSSNHTSQLIIPYLHLRSNSLTVSP